MAFTGYTNRSERTYIPLSSPPLCQNLLQSSFLASSEQSLALCHPLPPTHWLLPLAAFCGSCVINTNLLTWPGFGVQISCTISLNFAASCERFLWSFRACLQPLVAGTNNATAKVHSLTLTLALTHALTLTLTLANKFGSRVVYLI